MFICNDPEARWNDSQFISSFIGNITLFRVDFTWISNVKISKNFKKFPKFEVT